jgi:REP element-mobilizing transposase RayT
LDIPGLLHHVIARGIERCDIFRDDVDRRSFVTRLGHLLESTHTECFAWALLSNHFHLVLRPDQVSLALLLDKTTSSAGASLIGSAGPA